MKHQFLWLDLETTGLDPMTDHILEFAAVLAADHRDGDMSPIQIFTAPIAYTKKAIKEMRAAADPYVQRTHDENGLWEDCTTAQAMPFLDADEILAHVCGSELGAQPSQIMLAGASVHFDLAFIRPRWPRFARFLSHGVLDVTSLSYAERSWGTPDKLEIAPRETHRALPDILATLKDATAIRSARYGL